MNKRDLINYIEMNGGVITAKKNPYLQVPNSFIRSTNYSIYEKMVYQVLATYAGSVNNCFPSKETIAKELIVSVKTVERALKTLCDKECILIVNRKWDTGAKTSNLYILGEINWETGEFEKESLKQYKCLIGEALKVKSIKKKVDKEKTE